MTILCPNLQLTPNVIGLIIYNITCMTPSRMKWNISLTVTVNRDEMWWYSTLTVFFSFSRKLHFNHPFSQNNSVSKLPHGIKHKSFSLCSCTLKTKTHTCRRTTQTITSVAVKLWEITWIEEVFFPPSLSLQVLFCALTFIVVTVFSITEVICL